MQKRKRLLNSWIVNLRGRLWLWENTLFLRFSCTEYWHWTYFVRCGITQHAQRVIGMDVQMQSQPISKVLSMSLNIWQSNKGKNENITHKMTPGTSDTQSYWQWSPCFMKVNFTKLIASWKNACYRFIDWFMYSLLSVWFKSVQQRLLKLRGHWVQIHHKLI